MRKELRTWLRQLHEELKFTSVFVTHDQDEALELADRVITLNRGRIALDVATVARAALRADYGVVRWVGTIPQGDPPTND